MKAVIMAGGRGTRIAALAGDLPKPMLPIDGRPVLERELGSLREQGVTDVLITVGHLAPAIMEYFGDGSGCSPQTGRPFGVHIEYFVEKEPLGNAGALFRIRDRLDEDFLLLNGDVMFDVDLQRFAAFHKVHGGLATLFTELIPKFQVGVVEFSVEYFLFIPLTLAMLFIISNTIRLTVFARRKEIAIMKYVGATNWFIRWPFLLEGLLLGFIGGVLADLALWQFYGFAVTAIHQSLAFLPMVSVYPFMYRTAAILLVISMIIGALGSTISLKRYMKV